MSAAEALAALFPGGAHGTHGEPELDQGKCSITSTARTLRKPATVEHWRKHLAGERPLGVVPIREDGTCLWGCIDVDVYDDDHRRTINTSPLLVPCRSKSGGLHLFLFLKEPAPAAAVQVVLREAAEAAGLSGCEIFPKQARLERGDVGNWMVMPYFGGTFGGKVQPQVGLTADGRELSVEEFAALAEARRVAPEKLGTLAAGGGDYCDGPPCLEKLVLRGVPQGGRNKVLFNVGVYARKKHGDRWPDELEEANRQMMRRRCQLRRSSRSRSP